MRSLAIIFALTVLACTYGAPAVADDGGSEKDLSNYNTVIWSKLPSPPAPLPRTGEGSRLHRAQDACDSEQPAESASAASVDNCQFAVPDNVLPDNVVPVVRLSAIPEVAVPDDPVPDSTCDERPCDTCVPRLRCHNCPCFYGEVESLLMDRVPLFQNRPVLVDANTGTTFQSTGDLDSGFDPGVRAMIGMRLCNGLAMEFGYFGISESGYDLTAQPSATSYLIFPGNLAGNVFVNMSSLQTYYSSYVNSFELNFPCCCGCCATCDCGEPSCGECGRARPACGMLCCQSLEWFAGLRYLDIGNDLDLVVQRREAGGVEQGNYSVLTGNRLIGGQVGARLRSTVDRFGWELTGKAGAYGNSAEQSQSVIDYPNFLLRPFTSASRNNTAFVGEINVSAIYRLTDALSLKAGYNVIWIQGLALAADQLDFNFANSTGGNGLNRDGGLLLHGANFGLEARW